LSPHLYSFQWYSYLPFLMCVILKKSSHHQMFVPFIAYLFSMAIISIFWVLPQRQFILFQDDSLVALEYCLWWYYHLLVYFSLFFKIDRLMKTNTFSLIFFFLQNGRNFLWMIGRYWHWNRSHVFINRI
jgi:hypothetical protein